MAVREAKVAVATPDTPQAASDLARKFLATQAQQSAIKKQYDAERLALLTYIKENKLEDDKTGITFEQGGAVLSLTYKLTPAEKFIVGHLDNDTILWAAEHGILGATKSAVAPHKDANPKMYENFQKVLAPADGSESLEFTTVQA